MFYEIKMVQAIGCYPVRRSVGGIPYMDIHKYRQGDEEVEVIEEGVENERIFGVFYIPFRRHHRTTVIRRPVGLEDKVE